MAVQKRRAMEISVRKRASLTSAGGPKGNNPVVIDYMKQAAYGHAWMSDQWAKSASVTAEA